MVQYTVSFQYFWVPSWNNNTIFEEFSLMDILKVWGSFNNHHIDWLTYFGPLLKEQPHLLIVNHCFLNFQWESHQETHSKVWFLSLTECLVGFEWGTFQFSLLHLIRAMAHGHASTQASSLMCVKIAPAISVYHTFCLQHWNGKNEKKTKNIKFNSDHFSLIFSNLSLTWMLYVQKFLVWSE